MKTWGKVKVNDYIYLIKWHNIGEGYGEIRKCKVIEVRKPTKEWTYIKFKHPQNTNDKTLSFTKTDTAEWLLNTKQYIEKQKKYLLITEFKENIITQFENNCRNNK